MAITETCWKTLSAPGGALQWQFEHKMDADGESRKRPASRTVQAHRSIRGPSRRTVPCRAAIKTHSSIEARQCPNDQREIGVGRFGVEAGVSQTERHPIGHPVFWCSCQGCEKTDISLGMESSPVAKGFWNPQNGARNSPPWLGKALPFSGDGQQLQRRGWYPINGVKKREYGTNKSGGVGPGWQPKH